VPERNAALLVNEYALVVRPAVPHAVPHAGDDGRGVVGTGAVCVKKSGYSAHDFNKK
jgi:hypothetical protein